MPNLTLASVKIFCIFASHSQSFFYESSFCGDLAKALAKAGRAQNLVQQEILRCGWRRPQDDNLFHIPHAGRKAGDAEYMNVLYQVAVTGLLRIALPPFHFDKTRPAMTHKKTPQMFAGFF